MNPHKTLDQLRDEFGDKLAGLLTRGFAVAYCCKDEAQLGNSMRRALTDAHRLLAEIHAFLVPKHAAATSANGTLAGEKPAQPKR